jgi:hypothetical protein
MVQTGDWMESDELAIEQRASVLLHLRFRLFQLCVTNIFESRGRRATRELDGYE